MRANAVREDAERCKRGISQPSNAASPQTLAWAEGLPGDIQPHELLRSFARIANVLAARWDDPEATHAYFDALLIGRRRGRAGFPRKAINELLALHRHYIALHPESPPVYY
jgi:hypothetical protein